MNTPTISYDDALDQIEAEMVDIGLKDFELGDFFVGKLYVRPVVVEAGDYLISKVHKEAHPYFLMAGEIEIITQEGKQVISAPYIDITLPGTRRFARAITNVLWCTVHHVGDAGTAEEVEDMVIEKRINKLLKS